MIRGALRPLIRGGLRGVIPGVTDEFQALIDSLFGAGEQGLLFVPEPGFRGEDVLYQDAAGTTLADANGDPVGLGLEWSKGLELGPELVVEANITLGDWVETADGYSFDSATANLGDGYDPLIVSVPSDKRYQLVFDVVVTGTEDLLIRDGGNVNTIAIVPSGSYTFAADSGTGGIEFRRSGTDPVAFDITNISVREIPGNHLTQPTSADRPTYNTDGSLHWLEGDGAGDRFSMPVLPASTDNLVVVAFRSDVNHTGYLYDSNLPRFGVFVNHEDVTINILGAGSVSPIPYTVAEWTILTVKTNSSGTVVRVDGVEVASNATGSSGWGQSSPRLLSRYTDAATFDGRVGGYVISTSDTSMANVESAENYLAKRVGKTL